MQDARNTDFAVEPGDAKHAANIAGGVGVDRPRALNLPYDRPNKSMDLTQLEPLLCAGKATPIVTHCGGGGRGQKARVYLEAQGFTNVINGGGPSVKEHWALFGGL
jgi:rhodanese-related sulfurtransferase